MKGRDISSKAKTSKQTGSVPLWMLMYSYEIDPEIRRALWTLAEHGVDISKLRSQLVKRRPGPKKKKAANDCFHLIVFHWSLPISSPVMNNMSHYCDDDYPCCGTYGCDVGPFPLHGNQQAMNKSQRKGHAIYRLELIA